MKNWFEHFLYQARVHPQKPALVMEDRVVTYEMLHQAIERCARRIVLLDLPRSDRVAVLVRNPIRHFTLCLALFRIGVQSISLEHEQSGIRQLKFSVVLGDRDAASCLDPANRVVDATDEWFSADPPASGTLPPAFRNGSDIYRATYTSGSTGVPKLIPRRVEGVSRRILKFIDTNWNAVLDLPGLSTNWGFMTACAAISTGRTVCFAESAFQAIRMIELFSIDFVMGSSEQLVALTRVARKTRAHTDSVRTIWLGGGILTRVLLEAAMTHVCNNMLCRYAASEVGVVAQADARDVLSKPGFAGYVVPGVAVSIRNAQGAECRPGETGVIHAHLGEDARPDAENGGWINLGDVGWLTTDGQLYVVGRTADTPTVASQASPVHEIEHHLRLEWDLTDAAVVLTEGPNPQIWIGIVGNPALTADAVAGALKQAGYSQLVKVFHLPAIPRSSSGKINRGDLKALMSGLAK
jgi:acyl-coenzyme A synthetase/AMP-(fatty) acid ligase